MIPASIAGVTRNVSSCSCLGQATRYLRNRRFLVASLGFHARTFSPLPYGILAAISRLWTAEIEKHVAKTLSKLALTSFTPRFLKMTLTEYEQHLRGGPQLMSHFVRDSSSPVNRKIGPSPLSADGTAIICNFVFLSRRCAPALNSISTLRTEPCTLTDDSCKHHSSIKRSTFTVAVIAGSL